jgi:hypothetical protein
LIFKEDLVGNEETWMSLSAKFDPFVCGAPCAVITRLAAEWLLEESAVEALFERHALDQYEREITLANVVAIMLDVASGTRRSPRAAYLARTEEIAASLSAFYGKLNRMETGIGQALVEHVAHRAGRLVRACGGTAAEPVPGVRSLILDGNMLAGTEHRLRPLRRTRAAALPGKALAVYECATGLVTQTILWEDAHSQERALVPELTIEPGTHLIADRNFCVRSLLCRIARSPACFTVRHHRGALPLESLEIVGKERSRGRCATGRVFEQVIRVVHDGEAFVWRMIRLQLDVPTRDGDMDIVLISNLPGHVPAAVIATAYRERWTIEAHFQRLTEWLHCEVSTLSHPRAALFAFAMSLVAGNLLAVVIASVRAAHGPDAAAQLSYCALVDEVAGAYRGMMLALPPAEWQWIQDCTPQQTARVFRQVAAHLDFTRLRKTTRGPKKPRRTPNCTNIRHVSTYRILNKQREPPC